MEFNGRQFLKAWNTQINKVHQFIMENSTLTNLEDDFLDVSDLKIKNVDEVVKEKNE